MGKLGTSHLPFLLGGEEGEGAENISNLIEFIYNIIGVDIQFEIVDTTYPRGLPHSLLVYGLSTDTLTSSGGG